MAQEDEHRRLAAKVRKGGALALGGEQRKVGEWVAGVERHLPDANGFASGSLPTYRCVDKVAPPKVAT